MLIVLPNTQEEVLMQLIDPLRTLLRMQGFVHLYIGNYCNEHKSTTKIVFID